MDPEANIKEQLDLARDIIANMDEMHDEDLESNAARLAELVIALHEWRKSGGFDPYLVKAE